MDPSFKNMCYGMFFRVYLETQCRSPTFAGRIREEGGYTPLQG